MQRTNIYLEERQAAGLDAVARREGVTRAEVVRRYVDRGLGSDLGDLAGDLEVIERTSGCLADDADLDVERGDGDRAAHLERMWSL